MLARDLVGEKPEIVEVVARSAHEIDITDQRVGDVIARAAPDVVINAAAYTQVDLAERERERAFAVNGRAVGMIGKAAAAIGAGVVHFGTDYVFDGRASEPYDEDAEPNPLSVYGASKLAGEHELQESGADYLIIRSQWLFGTNGRSFPRTMWERAAAGQQTRVVNDQYGRPTFTADLARATWKLLGSGGETDNWRSNVRRLVLHVANTGVTTWYEVARRVFASAGAQAQLEPSQTADYPTPTRRPARAVLDTARFEAIAGEPLPPWEAALTRFLDRLQADVDRGAKRGRGRDHIHSG